MILTTKFGYKVQKLRARVRFPHMCRNTPLEHRKSVEKSRKWKWQQFGLLVQQLFTTTCSLHIRMVEELSEGSWWKQLCMLFCMIQLSGVTLSTGDVYNGEKGVRTTKITISQDCDLLQGSNFAGFQPFYMSNIVPSLKSQVIMVLRILPPMFFAGYGVPALVGGLAERR